MTDRCDDFEPLHSAWVDGELRPAERARLAAHLQRCPRCRATINELRVTQTMLRSLPTRRLPATAVPPPDARPGRRRRVQTVRRVAVRSTAGALVFAALLGAASFAAGGVPQAEEPRVAVPVDIYVADHLVRAVGGPVSTPAWLQARP